MSRPAFPQREERLILASASRGRADLLRGAGLAFEVVPSGVDEEAVREVMRADGGRVDPADVAEVLARTKAETVSGRHPESLVVGADQVLALDGEMFAKPADMAAARAMLLRLKGREHRLHSAVCLARGGDTLWSHVESAGLVMRDLSPEFVGRYLAAAGPSALDSVGAYRIEGLGIHLFADIRGDHSTILGLPLTPLLAELRRLGALD